MKSYLIIIWAHLQGSSHGININGNCSYLSLYHFNLSKLLYFREVPLTSCFQKPHSIMQCSFLLLFYYLYKDIQVSMPVVLSESWSRSSLWSEEAQMQWLDSCYCKITQSKDEAVTFYCVQRPQGGNGQALKEKVTAITEYEVIINKFTFQKSQKFQGSSRQHFKQTNDAVFPDTVTSVFTLNVCVYLVSRLRSNSGGTKQCLLQYLAFLHRHQFTNKCKL